MRLQPALTLHTAEAALQKLRAEAAQQPGAWTIDASALVDFDSAALALLLHARRLAQAGGSTFAVTGAPTKLTQLAQLYGVDELLGLRYGADA
jgi:phospholipid transport system transporter-binding protein